MIAAVRGVLEQRSTDSVVVVVGGVSLRVYVPSSSLESLGEVGDGVRLFTHLVVREDALSLYGFATEEARRVFELLLSVSGVGPRIALVVLSAMGPQEVALAIASGDADALGRVPGVGKKRAARLVLELRGRLEKERGAVEVGAPGPGPVDAVTALVALGYTPSEARQAMAGLEPGLPLEERVRRALQHLAGTG
ncbi:MAG: Holliday junction branch migration protein RuvA [Chloroflexi bacterium]|nr:Holliday junction branch migration protein RuvA [Chloroflexota bacterium]